MSTICLSESSKQQKPLFYALCALVFLVVFSTDANSAGNDANLVQTIGGQLVAANNLNESGQYQQAITGYEQIIKQYGSNTSDNEIASLIAAAYLSKGVAEAELGLWDNSIATYSAMLERFSQTTNPQILDVLEITPSVIAATLMSQGMSLHAEGKLDEAVAVFGDVVNRFSNSDNNDIQFMYATAWAAQGKILQAQGNTSQAISAFDAVINRFSGSNNAKLKELVAIVQKDRATLVNP